jgi:hypothetical protein
VRAGVTWRDVPAVLPQGRRHAGRPILLVRDHLNAPVARIVRV